MSQEATIHFILTGGTIDSHWEANKDTVVPNEHSVIPDYIRGLKLPNPTEFTEVCMKDSRGLTHEDLAEIVKTAETSNHNKIIISHGTYTMADTARFLKANLKREDQAIVLTGSMMPLSGFDKSDASFNLGYAVSKVQALDKGIYLGMNGQLLLPEEVMKFISEGKFISIFQDKQ